jgi:hemolysin activation/secretion protein
MKKVIRAWVCFAALAVCATAAKAVDAQKDSFLAAIEADKGGVIMLADAQPSSRTPKTPPVTKEPAKLPEPAKPAAETAEDNTEVVPSLKGVVVVSDMKEIKIRGAQSVTGLVVRNIPLLEKPEFKAVVNPYIGKRMLLKDLKRLQRDTIIYCRHKNRPVVDVILPEQDLSNGVLQMLFLEGRLGKLAVQNPGTKWFSDKKITSKVRLKPGETIDSKRLLDDVNWLNQSPFRQVDVMLKQGQKRGESDIALNVKDRIPFRAYAGYEDSGTALTGKDRLLGGFNWGNAAGFDELWNYQYMTDSSADFLRAHSGSLVVPLPWRHTITVSGAYVHAKADFSGTSFTALNQEARSWQSGFRYGAPLTSVEVTHVGQFSHQLTGGFDFKRSNNNLEFGGAVVSPSDTEIFQFEGGYSCALSDPFGQTSFGLEAYYSPGNWSDRNTAAEFQNLRAATQSSYLYGRLSLERLTKLPYNFSWSLTAATQLTEKRLLPSEQMGLGGYQTVRGYDERVINGDQGWYVSNELRLPPFSVLRLTRLSKFIPWGQTEQQVKGKPFDQFQLFGFWDHGLICINQVQPGEAGNQWLSATGFGCRYSFNPYVYVRFDYGWQLHESGATRLTGLNFSQNSRGHISVVVGF